MRQRPLRTGDLLLPDAASDAQPEAPVEAGTRDRLLIGQALSLQLAPFANGSQRHLLTGVS